MFIGEVNWIETRSTVLSFPPEGTLRNTSIIFEQLRLIDLTAHPRQSMERYLSLFDLEYLYNHCHPQPKGKQPQKRTSVRVAPFPLMSLAPELHLIVAETLDPFDRLSLKLTNRHFFQLISPVQFSSKDLASAQAQLYKRRGPDTQAVPGTPIKADRFPYLACMSCMRLRLSTSFADDQTRWSPVLKVPRRLTKTTFVKHYSLFQRFCIDCGVNEKKDGFQQGQIVKVDQKEYVICNFCSNLGRKVGDGSRRQAAGLCEVCWIRLEITRSGRADGEEGTGEKEE